MGKIISRKKLNEVKENLHAGETIALHIINKFLKKRTPEERYSWLQDIRQIGCAANPSTGLSSPADVWAFHKKHKDNIDELLNNMSDGIIFNSGFDYLTTIAHFAFQEVAAYLLGELT